MKRISKWVAAFLPVALLTGCTSQRVLTDVMKTYPDVVPAEQVRVFSLKDSLPNGAELMGYILVTDNATSRTVPYDSTLQMARRKVGELGGNGLQVVGHTYPGLHSTNHELSGTMLHLRQTFSPQEIEADYRERLVAMERIENERRVSPHNVYGNIGYSRITSDITFNGTIASGNPKNGLDWELGYDYLLNNYFVGIGVMAKGFSSSFVGVEDSEVSDYTMRTLFLGPNFLLFVNGKKFLMKAMMAIGYFSYTNSAFSTRTKQESGSAVYFAYDFEYKLTQQWGVGLKLFSQDWSNGKDEKGNINGIRWLGLNLGVRYYF